MIAVFGLGADALTHGVILGLVYGVLAAGLVLVYRASGVVNFAYGETGALGAAVLAKLVLDEHWPWLGALPVVLALGGLIGAATELVVARRLRNRPRLTLLVATIGLSQVLLVGQYLLPAIREVAPYPSPLHRRWTFGPVVLTGRDFVAIAVVPAIVVGLALWLARTPSGRALRAVADNRQAAELAGIPSSRISLGVWTLAGVLSTATAVLAGPLQGATVARPTEAIGAGLLVRALAAALLGRLRSVGLALAGGIGVGVIQAAAETGRFDPAVADVVLLGAVLAIVLLRPVERQRGGSRPDGELVRVPAVRRRRSPGRPGAGSVAAVAAVVLAAGVPLVAGRSSQLFSLSRLGLYAMVGLSLVVLTGWAGQLSLGQFAFVGLGTFGAAVAESHGVPFLVSVVVAAAGGAAVSIVVGLPALRVRGLELAVTTLALAVAARSWLFTRGWMAPHGEATVPHVDLLGLAGRGPVAFYELCVAGLAVAVAAVAALRRSGFARRLLAVRSNDRRAATLGVSPTAARLAAFATAGLIAATAGALLGALRVRSGAADFSPDESLRIVALTVIGGAGAAIGPLVGAVFVLGVPALFGDTTIAGLLPSGAGLLALVLVVPGGFVEAAGSVRGWAIGHRPTPTPASPPDRRAELDPDERRPPAPGTDLTGPGPSGPPGNPPSARPSPVGRRLVVGAVTVVYDGRVALDAVDLVAEPGQLVGLIGSNGSGKTTLLDAISGFVAPVSGRIDLDDRPLGRLSPTARARVGLARTMQDARLFEDLVVWEAVALAAPGRGRARRRVVDDALGRVGLEGWADTACQDLPTGARRQAELACALVRRPGLLLLDEPSAGLGRRESETLVPLLGHLCHQLGATVVLVEHDVGLVRTLADRLVCLGAGKVLAAGEPGAVLADPVVIGSFLGPRAGPRPGGPPGGPAPSGATVPDSSP